ncbi:MAG: helix-turn-helix transcriptional regulator [Gemmatimonadetes bacterium]|nr:helix-turn-helix transcriptional regulator [Gemmatimonadota bacterium]MBI4543170.1 helix-turn-helix transcriptional regulator [Gemmatimonadota bacterium]
MRIERVIANNRRRVFEVRAGGRVLGYPYARLRVKPTAEDRIKEVFPDGELGYEALTYVLESGKGDTVHLDAVLEYNEDPDHLRDLLLYKLTLEAQKRVAESGLSKRELIRRLGTSASQLYRLLDQTNYTKSVGQMLALLHILGCDVDLIVKKRRKTA